jgi:hypothetical protein
MVIFAVGVFAPPVGAQVIRMPPIERDFGFTRQPAFFADSEVWADYRWYQANVGPADFGTDFELGAQAGIFSTSRFSASGYVRMLYQARQLPEYDNPFAFSPRHLMTDLAFLGAYRMNRFVAYGGWRHDCTHEVDQDGGRTPVHDVVLVGTTYEPPSFPWSNPALSSEAAVRLEGEVNVPSLFVSSAAFTDRGRAGAGLRIEPVVHEDYGGLFVDGYAAAIFRDAGGTNIDGIDPINFDWNVAVGYQSPGTDGSLSIYYRVERITDPWFGRDVKPVLLSGVGAVLHMR